MQMARCFLALVIGRIEKVRQEELVGKFKLADGIWIYFDILFVEAF